MQENEWWYHRLLQRCQSPDLEQRLDALEDLRQDEALARVPAQFLLDRLNSTRVEREQAALLQLMCEVEEPLPIQALMAMLADQDSSLLFLRMHVAHTLAVVQAEDALPLLLRVLHDETEDGALREVIIWDLPLWGDRAPRELLLDLLAHPELCAAALDAWRSQPPLSIPLEAIVPYCAHEDPYLRAAAIKTLLVAEQRVPPEPILVALHDSQPEVRVAASYGCIRLLELFGDQIPLEPLLQALGDDYPPVRENILDALSKVPLRIPVEPVAAALTDSTFYVRCAALETLSLMGECVPSLLYPVLQGLSGADPSGQVRLRATRAMLLLHGIQAPPLRIPIVDLTLSDLEGE